MADSRSLQTYYRIEAKHLRQLETEEGVKQIIAEISGFDTDYVTFTKNGRQVEEPRHMLRFNGWKVGLILNNGKIRQLEDWFGFNTDDWVGHKVRLCVVAYTAYGEQKEGVGIDTPPNLQVEVTDPPAYLSSGGFMRLPAPTPPQPLYLKLTGASVSQPPKRQLPQAEAKDSTPIGTERAIKLLTAVRLRGLLWQDIVNKVRDANANAAEAMADRPLEDVPAWCVPLLGEALKAFPVTREGEREQIEKECRKSLTDQRGWDEVPPKDLPF